MLLSILIAAVDCWDASEVPPRPPNWNLQVITVISVAIFCAWIALVLTTCLRNLARFERENKRRV